MELQCILCAWLSTHGKLDAAWGLLTLRWFQTPRAGHVPPEPWLRELWPALARSLTWRVANPQHASTTLWALVLLQLRPPHDVVQRGVELLLQNMEVGARGTSGWGHASGRSGGKAVRSSGFGGHDNVPLSTTPGVGAAAAGHCRGFV